MKENRRIGVLDKAKVLLAKAAGTGNGNVRYQTGDVVTVKETGQIVRLNPKLSKAEGKRFKRERTRTYGEKAFTRTMRDNTSNNPQLNTTQT